MTPCHSVPYFEMFQKILFSGTRRLLLFKWGNFDLRCTHTWVYCANVSGLSGNLIILFLQSFLEFLVFNLQMI